MKLLLLILIFIKLSAIDNTNVVVYNESLYVNEKHVTQDYKGTYTNKDKIFQNRLKVKLYTNLTDDLMFNVMGVYNYNNIDDVYKTDILRNTTYKNNELYFENLYVTYNIYKSFYMVVGMVNFGEGSYNELSELDYIKGAGLSKIINTPIDAVFLLKRSKIFGYNSITKIGLGEYGGSNIPRGSYAEIDADGSKGLYITHNMYKDFDSIKFNYFEGDINKDNIVVGHSRLMGIGFNKYFLKNGINVFSTLGYCINDVYGSKTTQLLTVSPFVVAAFPNSFSLVDATTRGQLYSLGVSKDIDSSLVESYNIGMDYTYTTDNWTSLVNSDYNDVYNSRFMNGKNLYLWGTVKFTTNVALKFFNVYVRLNNAKAIGNPTIGIPFEDSLVKYPKAINRTGLKLIIKY